MQLETNGNKRLITIESFDTRLWYDMLTTYNNYTDFEFIAIMNTKRNEIEDDPAGRQFTVNITHNPEDGTKPLFYFADDYDDAIEPKIYDQDYLELDFSTFQTFVQTLSEGLNILQEEKHFNDYGDTNIAIVIEVKRRDLL